MQQLLGAFRGCTGGFGNLLNSFSKLVGLSACRHELYTALTARFYRPLCIPGNLWFKSMASHGLPPHARVDSCSSMWCDGRKHIICVSILYRPNLFRLKSMSVRIKSLISTISLCGFVGLESPPCASEAETSKNFDQLGPSKRRVAVALAEFSSKRIKRSQMITASIVPTFRIIYIHL